MVERLTEFNKTGWVLKLDEPQNEFEARQQLMSKFKLACKKLGQLEDILEKYDLEVEELDERIHNGAFNYIDKLKAETERDTWKRACELACDVILRFTDGCPCKADYFYQQAKTEGNDERN